MSQRKTHSLLEVCSSTTFGFIVALASQEVLFPLFSIKVPLSTNLWLTLWFTIISVARSYLFRRLFNRITG